MAIPTDVINAPHKRPPTITAERLVTANTIMKPRIARRIGVLAILSRKGAIPSGGSLGNPLIYAGNVGVSRGFVTTTLGRRLQLDQNAACVDLRPARIAFGAYVSARQHPVFQNFELQYARRRQS